MSARSERFVAALPLVVIMRLRSRVVVVVSCYFERSQKAPAWLRGRTWRKSTLGEGARAMAK